MAVDRNALKKWEKVREFAPGMPGAAEATRRSRTSMQPLGRDRCEGQQEGVRLPRRRRRQLSAGRHREAQRKGAPAAELLCDWVEESYRTIAPKLLIAELDGR